ncbi:MAG: hypothetical protein QOG38_2038 [Hyphomicrobiales bacterium]|jgi:hypothetical protein|nr:hypothetical protein [Hyphomicrobiales bacterium]
MRCAALRVLLCGLALIVGEAAAAHAAGALATGACGAYGYAFDDASIRSAEHRAISECKGKGCQVRATVRRACAAFAIDGGNVCGPNGWATAKTLGRAQNAASKHCYQFGGRNCVIRAWMCDAKG